MSDRDLGNLLGILEAIEKIEIYTRSISNPDDFVANTMIFDAVMMNFVQIGEMCSRLSGDLKSRYSEVEWKKIVSFRNMIAHDYLGIDAEEVWQILQVEINPLKDRIREIIN